jgi:cell division septum initiation protein DivIVA
MDPLDEIARLRARAAPPDPLAEIRALRERLARLEQVAQAATTPTGDTMENAIRDAYRLTEPADKERARLQSIARGFVPDPQSEDALHQRAKDPAAYDRAMEAMHVSGLPLALYERGRTAAVKLGTFVPDKEGAK